MRIGSARTTSRAALVGAFAVVIAGCGSGAVKSVASSLTAPTATTAAAQTTTPRTTSTPSQTTTVTKTQTVTAPSRTETVTSPAQTTTVVHTQAATTPTTTSTSSANPAAAAAAGAAVANENESSESSGLPGWAWLLIGAAATGLVIWAVIAFRRRRARHQRSMGADSPPANGPPDAEATLTPGASDTLDAQEKRREP